MKKLLIILLFSTITLFSFSQTIDLNIDVYKEYQEIEGFGCAAASWLLSAHNNTTVADLAVNDLGLSILRVYPPPEFESTNDNSDPNSANISNFGTNESAVTSQMAVVSKFVDAGLENVILSTFSPPAWMKYNNSLVGDDCLSTDPSCQNRLRHDMYDEYSEYYSTYINYVIDQTGANVYAISPENEPAWGQWYNSCVFSPDEMKNIINVLGARFVADGINTKIFGAEDLMPSFGNYESVMMGDETCKGYTDILATHAYADGISPISISQAAGTWTNLGEFAEEYDKSLWMSETSGYSGAFEDAELTYAQLIHTALKYGHVSGWIYLNVTTNSGQQEERALMVNNTPQKMFYASKQFYRYIRPGAVMVDCSDDESNQVFATAFRHGEESRMTVVAINSSSSSKTVNIVMDNKPGTFTHYRTTNGDDCITVGTTDGTNITLTAHSINTFVAEGDNKLPLIDKIKDTVLVMNTTSSFDIDLTGISDGDDDKTQTISITAESSNTSLISNPTVTYTSGESTGTITLQPQADQTGTTKITLTITDNGGATNNNYFSVRKVSFEVKVIPFVNSAPEITGVKDLTVTKDPAIQILEITGVNDGNDGSQTVIAINTENSNTAVIEVTAIYTPGANSMQLYYLAKQTGTATITLTLYDDAGTDLGGIDTKTLTFTISVEEPLPGNIATDGEELIIYPNPAKDIINISSGKDLQQISLINIQGQHVLENVYTNSNNESINISDIPIGYYWLNIIFKNGTSIKRPIIKE